MKRLIRKCVRRLKNGRGETITEVLVALLVSALALTMLAAMVAASTRMVNESRNKIDEYYQAGNGMAALSGSAAGTGRAALTGEGTSDEWELEYYTDGNGTVSYRVR